MEAIFPEVTILPWVEGFSAELAFEGEGAIASSLLGELNLTAAQF